ncbi:MAG: Rieske 2Fe-2S domain-containing protein [Cyanobacteria bacterium J06638_6]
MAKSIESTIAEKLRAIAPVNDIAPVISNDWHVVASDADLAPTTLRAIRLLGKDLVLWRGADKIVQVWGDRCPH